MKVKQLLVAGLLLATVLAAFPAAAKNVALVIGNGAYQNTSALPNPGRDAEAFAAFLRGAGYEVTTVTDGTRSQMSQALAKFGQSLQPDDTAVFYYAGHGLQMAGENYLMGVEASLFTEFDVPAESVSLNDILELMEAKAQVSMLFIDACRNNPLAEQMAKTATRSVARGLAPVEVSGDGAMVAFAAGPGQVAFDGDGGNSPFTGALVRHLGTPGLEVSVAFKRVIADVRSLTARQQEPQIVSSLATEVFFGGTSGAVLPVVPVVDLAEVDYAKAERLNTTRGWQLYLEKHPEGFFAELAQKALDLLLGRPIEGSTPEEIENNLALSREQRREIQVQLNELGYSLGAPDGVFGSNSRREFARYQVAAGLQETGFVSGAMLTKLGIAVVGEETTVVSADEARRFDVSDLDGLETDQRLLAALRCLGNKQVQYGFFEGHAYIAVLSWGQKWVDSRAEAVRCGGDLVSLNSKAENDFVFELFARDDRFFRRNVFSPTEISIGGPLIGMNQDPAGREPSGGWSWSDGTEVAFENWDDQSNSRDNEDIASYWSNFHFVEPPSDYTQLPRTWGDIEDYAHAYVMELQ
jgi:hypothetical protein